MEGIRPAHIRYKGLYDSLIYMLYCEMYKELESIVSGPKQKKTSVVCFTL